jgi:hypothetical protein
MPLFQKSVLDHYKSQLDSDKLREAYQRLQSQFLDPDKQAQIRASKEEQYQEGFIRDLFCKVLGYTISPNPDFNIITEVKNQNNSKKADAGF